MPEDFGSLRCDACGQGFKLQLTDQLNKTAPKFCPICGTPTLRKAKHVLGIHDAACFTGVDAQLLQLLFTEWALYAKKADPQAALPDAFVCYVRKELE